MQLVQFGKKHFIQFYDDTSCTMLEDTFCTILRNYILYNSRKTLFEAEGFGLLCTALAGSGLLVKSRLIRIRAYEGARERTRSFEIYSLCLLRRSVTFP
jgi:hypothetical protein